MKEKKRMLFLYFVIILVWNAKCDDRSSGSALLLQRFDTIHEQFEELKEEMGVVGESFKSVKNVKDDPTAHLKASSCNEGGCMNNFIQDNSTSVFEWYRKLSTDESFPFRPATARKALDMPFMVAKIDKHHKRNEHSILTADIPIKTTRQCIDFYYYMYNDDGCDVVRFSVTLKCVGYPDEPILKISGSKSKEWNYVLYDVNRPVGTKCQILWRAAKGLSEEGKVGIDEINVHYEACPTHGRVLSTRLGCNFVNTFCMWKPSFEPGQLKWKPGTHNLLSMGHNNVLVNESRHDVNIKHIKTISNSRTGVLTSPIAVNSAPRCFTMKWLMVGRKPGRLTISFLRENGTATVAWSVFGKIRKSSASSPAKWSLQAIDLPVDENFKVEIKYTSANQTNIYVTITDINVLDGECAVYLQTLKYHQQQEALAKRSRSNRQCNAANKNSKCNKMGAHRGTQSQSVEENGQVSSCIESFIPVILIYTMCNFVRHMAASSK